MAQAHPDYSRAAEFNPSGLKWMKRLGRLAAFLFGAKQLEGGDYEAGQAVYGVNHGPTLLLRDLGATSSVEFVGHLQHPQEDRTQPYQ